MRQMRTTFMFPASSGGLLALSFGGVPIASAFTIRQPKLRLYVCHNLWLRNVSNYLLVEATYTDNAYRLTYNIVVRR